MPGKLLMNLSYRELTLLGEMLAIQMGLAMYPSHDRAFEDMRMAQKIAYLLNDMRLKGKRAVIIDLNGSGVTMCKEGNAPIKPEPEHLEADSVPDLPLDEVEGARLLALIRGCEPEDWELETDITPPYAGDKL